MAQFDTPPMQDFDWHARPTPYWKSETNSGRPGGSGRNDHTRGPRRARNAQSAFDQDTANHARDLRRARNAQDAFDQDTA
jgi:hypothetical protein